jgi:hypothetical protein
MTTATQKGKPTDVQPVARDAILEQYAPMLMAVPLAEDDDGSGIIAAILTANTPEALNTGTKLPDAEAMIGKTLRIDKIERRESDLEDNTLGYYLIARGVEGPRQEPFVFGTGSVGITAVLVKLWAHGWLPAVVEVRKAAKATKAGRYPLNLHVVSVPGA